MHSPSNPTFSSSSTVFWTCSIHGENDEILPPVFCLQVVKERLIECQQPAKGTVYTATCQPAGVPTLIASLADSTACQGLGRSKNTAQKYHIHLVVKEPQLLESLVYQRAWSIREPTCIGQIVDPKSLTAHIPAFKCDHIGQSVSNKFQPTVHTQI